MKKETKYRYEKRIKELESENLRLLDHLYDYRTACSEIYDGIVQALTKGHTSTSIPWILLRLKRIWRQL